MFTFGLFAPLTRTRLLVLLLSVCDVLCHLQGSAFCLCFDHKTIKAHPVLFSNWLCQSSFCSHGTSAVAEGNGKMEIFFPKSPTNFIFYFFLSLKEPHVYGQSSSPCWGPVGQWAGKCFITTLPLSSLSSLGEVQVINGVKPSFLALPEQHSPLWGSCLVCFAA